jgi:ABC-type nickel/cobalt efflux system permease component RcnA
MSPKTRNLIIYAGAAFAAVVLASRCVTLALVLAYAPEDAEPYFFLKQFAIAVICVLAIVWLWRQRVRQPADSEVETSD